MLLLAHTGITLGAAYLLQQVGKTKKLTLPSMATGNKPGNTKAVDSQITERNPVKSLKLSGRCMAFFRELADRVDYRFILVGSLLPDFIDKPLGNIFLNHIFASGRIFAHTLLFLVLIAVLAIVLYRTKKQVWGYYLVFGTITHFLLDQIWLTPGTIFWPFLGLTFEKLPEMDIITLINFWLNGLITEPAVYISEILGCLILIFFGIKILEQKKVRAFFLKGII